MGFYNVSWILAMSLVSSNTAGATKKSLGSGSMGIFYGILNLYIFPLLPYLELQTALADNLYL